MSSSNEPDPIPNQEKQQLLAGDEKGGQVSKQRAFLTGYLKKAIFALLFFALLGSAFLMFATWLISSTILSALPK